MNNHLLQSKILLLCVIGMVLPARPAAAGCYCMMESQSVQSGLSKIGYRSYCDTNVPTDFFMHEHEISTWNYHPKSSDDSFTSETKFNSVDDNDGLYQFVVISYTNYYYTNINLDIHTDDNSIIGTGGDPDDSYSLVWNHNNINGGCSGTWTAHNYVNGEPYLIADDTGPCCEPTPHNPVYNTLFPTDVPWVPVADECSPSRVHTESTYDYDYSDEYSSSSEHDKKTDTQVYDSLLSDDVLRGYMKEILPPWPTNWAGGTGVAFYNLNLPNHEAGGCGKMQYRVKVPNSDANTTYTLQWQEVISYPGTTNTSSTTMSEDIKGTGDPVNPAMGTTHLVDVPATPSSITETAPSIIKTTSTGSPPSSPPGSPSSPKPMASL